MTSKSRSVRTVHIYKQYSRFSKHTYKRIKHYIRINEALPTYIYTENDTLLMPLSII